MGVVVFATACVVEFLDDAEVEFVTFEEVVFVVVFLTNNGTTVTFV